MENKNEREFYCFLCKDLLKNPVFHSNCKHRTCFRCFDLKNIFFSKYEELEIIEKLKIIKESNTSFIKNLNNNNQLQQPFFQNMKDYFSSFFNKKDMTIFSIESEEIQGTNEGPYRCAICYSKTEVFRDSKLNEKVDNYSRQMLQVQENDINLYKSIYLKNEYCDTSDFFINNFSSFINTSLFGVSLFFLFPKELNQKLAFLINECFYQQEEVFDFDPKKQEIVCWGNLTPFGLEQVQSPIKFPFQFRIKQIACGEFHLILLTNTGDCYSLGSNSHGQLGIGLTTSTQNYQILQKIKFCEELSEYEKDKNQFRVKKILSGKSHCLAITEDYKKNKEIIFGWGTNFSQELFLNSPNFFLRPVSVHFFKDKKIKKISCDASETFILTEDEQLYRNMRLIHYYLPIFGYLKGLSPQPSKSLEGKFDEKYIKWTEENKIFVGGVYSSCFHFVVQNCLTQEKMNMIEHRGYFYNIKIEANEKIKKISSSLTENFILLTSGKSFRVMKSFWDSRFQKLIRLNGISDLVAGKDHCFFQSHEKKIYFSKNENSIYLSKTEIQCIDFGEWKSGNYNVNFIFQHPYSDFVFGIAEKKIA